MSAIASKKSGTVSAVEPTKRRCMSTSSAFFDAVGAAVTTFGSSAIPQIGHVPGPFCTICGCIGHVYSASSETAPSGRCSEGVSPSMSVLQTQDSRHSYRYGGPPVRPSTLLQLDAVRSQYRAQAAWVWERPSSWRLSEARYAQPSPFEQARSSASHATAVRPRCESSDAKST